MSFMRTFSFFPLASCFDATKIEVTFELDENGVLHVSAVDKANGNSKKLEISYEKSRYHSPTNSKKIFVFTVLLISSNRLKDTDLEDMIREAEEAAESDRIARERVTARNAHEAYVYQVRNVVRDEEKTQGKLSADEISAVEECVREEIEWLEENPEVEKERYEERLKEMEEKVQKIIAKVYGGEQDAHTHSYEQEEPDFHSM